MELVLAVKDVTKFLYSTGDLSLDMNNDEIGKEIHTYWQKKYLSSDIREYYLKHKFNILGYGVTIQGFMDGLIEDCSTVEEIKTSFVSMDKVEVKKEHLAQAKFYAYLYLLEKEKESINVRITYIHFDTKEVLKFDYEYDIKQLEDFFNESMNEYVSWIKKLDDHQLELINNVKDLKFPFTTYRKNQKDLIKDCYNNILNNEILFEIAPTGIGKTISTLFPAIKSINKPNTKIFYLTAKTSGKSVAINTLKLLKENGSKIKAIELTAKEKMCAMGQKICNPEKCPYMVSYYEKVKNAIYDMYDNHDIIDRETIFDRAMKYEICPFEYSLDLSNYADIVIGDYNYAFCPRTHLIRYFDTLDYNQILLVDEAHNLVSRAKDMYSSSFTLSDVDNLCSYISKFSKTIDKYVNEFYDIVSEYERDFNYSYEIPYDFISTLRKIVSKANKILQTDKAKKIKDKALPYYFELSDFLKISEYFDFDFRFIVDYDTYSIKCLDASKFVSQTLSLHSTSSIFFSATMFPIDYYKNLLTQNNGLDKKIDSPFDPNNLLLIIRRNTQTKYSERENSINDILECINEMIKYKVGNYIVFFPSYEYMNMVISNLEEPDYECIIQEKNLSEDEKNGILDEFKKSDTTKVGFFIMGGVFSEGIDYIGDMLSGVMIVSVSLPPFDEYNNMLKEYYDSTDRDGFKFAYLIPGMSKVIQSVGRVIRSETDKGVAILYDDRFAYSDYKSKFPPSWKNIRYAYSNDNVRVLIENFKNKK